MIIANPIYDTVLKYLMEDTDIAKFDYKSSSNDPLIKQITDRLTKAIADEDLRRKMNIEDEIERGYNMELQEMEIKLEAKIEEKYKQEIEDLKRQLAEKNK